MIMSAYFLIPVLILPSAFFTTYDQLCFTAFTLLPTLKYVNLKSSILLENLLYQDSDSFYCVLKFIYIQVARFYQNRNVDFC